MKRIAFGTMQQDGHPATFDLEALIVSRLLISANSGGGKSYMIRKLLEVSHGKVQQIVVDLEGEFATLREQFDYLLVASKGGDLRIDVRTVELLARTILENQGTSVILDLSELKDQERKHYVRVFLDSLIAAPRELWHPCVVVIDEAHHFDPEGAEAESSSAVNDLMTRGRKRGLCGWLATQRLAKLNKDAAAEANNVMVGRTVIDVDQRRAKDILGFASLDDARALRELEPGVFWAFGPALPAGVNLVKGGQVQTTVPKIGAKGGLAKLPPPASDKIKSVIPRFAEVSPERAEVDLRDRQATAKRIRELEAEARGLRLHSGTVSPEKVKEIQEEYFAKGQSNGSREVQKVVVETMAKLKQMRDLAAWNLRVARKAVNLSQEMASELKEVPEVENAQFFPKAMPTARAVAVASSPPLPPPRPFAGVSQGPGDDDEPRLKKGALEMLRNAARFYPQPISRDQIGALSGFSVSGGTFQDYLSQLKKRALIEERSDGLHATDAGLALIGPVDPLPSDPQYLIEMWAPKFKAGVGKMLRILAARYPDSIGREDLGAESGYASSGGTFQDYLSQLKRNGLAVTEGDQVKASPALMEGPR